MNSIFDMTPPGSINTPELKEGYEYRYYDDTPVELTESEEETLSGLSEKYQKKFKRELALLVNNQESIVHPQATLIPHEQRMTICRNLLCFVYNIT